MTFVDTGLALTKGESVFTSIEEAFGPGGFAYKQDYVFEPVGWDAIDPHALTPQSGIEVSPIPPPPGCPDPVPMGHVYIQDAETAEFYGLCLIDSLVG